MKLSASLQVFNLEPDGRLPAGRVKAPLIKECPVNLECQVKQILPLGSHDLFLGEVVAAHMDTEIQDEKGRMARQE